VTRLAHSRSLKNILHDKYLPSFLLRGEVPEFVFHALAATGIESGPAAVCFKGAWQSVRLVIRSCTWRSPPFDRELIG
jgi:hypothetical protein